MIYHNHLSAFALDTRFFTFYPVRRHHCTHYFLMRKLDEDSSRIGRRRGADADALKTECLQWHLAEFDTRFVMRHGSPCLVRQQIQLTTVVILAWCLFIVLFIRDKRRSLKHWLAQISEHLKKMCKQPLQMAIIHRILGRSLNPQQRRTDYAEGLLIYKVK